MKGMGSVEEVSNLLTQWEETDRADGDVTPILTKLTEVFELETQAFLKQDPDPFDDRHPSRSQPDCTLGHILKTVFRNRRIVDEMVKVYCQRDVIQLNTVVCRFLLALLPALESVIFQEEGFVLRLFHWAEYAPNPLQSYATGLLAAAMDVPEIASSYREKNANLVPLMLKRLYELSRSFLQSTNCDDQQTFLSPNRIGMYDKEKVEDRSVPNSEDYGKTHKKSSRKKKDGAKSRYSPIYSETKSKEKKTALKIPPVDASLLNEGSNSNWAEYMFGSYQVFPLTSATQQRYILQYLTPMGEYQELIGHVFEENALALILRYIDLQQNHDIRLAFEALKYLSSLLCHKKIAIEFLNMGGLQLLLKVPRPSIAATGVSICLYYLGYLEEAMEKVCSTSDNISEIVSYALWLLECSHNSSQCHAALFFGFGFTFKAILQHFDQQDGLRKLFNVMSTLDVFVSQNARTLSDDEIFANRLTTKHVCGSLKRYFEAHLTSLVEEKRLLSCRMDYDSGLEVRLSKAASLTSEVVERNMEILHDLSLVPLSQWKPVNEFINLDGVTFLLELISSYFELSYSGRVETVKNALDVLKICALTVSGVLKFCEKLSSPEHLHVTGISILLQAAEGELMPVSEVQHSALLSIVNCVCTKIPTVESSSSSSRTSTTPKKKSVRQIEELLNKVWKAVRIKNGIIVLINLLSIKNPITDADSIRALACKALCGLARSETVKQIVSKLPLITNGQLIDLMKEPVLQDKCHDHVQFCKYGLELIERVTGAPLSAASQNLNKICVSEVVAKTKVVYQDAQLLQLICDHLTQKGFSKTLSALQQEMEEKSVTAKSPISLEAFPSLNKNLWLTPKKTFDPVEKGNKFSLSSSASSIPPPTVPLKIVVNRKFQIPDVKHPPYRLQKPQTCLGSFVQSPAFQKNRRQSAAHPYKDTPPSISLDSIVIEYLRKQHSLCKNPMLACPPFDLFIPHKCPEPHFKRNAPVNCVLRIQKREICFQNGGYRGAALNTKHIYSRFRLYRTCRDEEGRCDFTTCAFFNSSDPCPKMLIGTVNGKLKAFDVNTAKEILSKDCHFRGISHIESRESSTLLITSDGGRVGNSSLWSFSLSDIDLIHNFSEVSHMEFGKRSVDRAVGTKQDAAVIYDTSTFAELQNFPVEDLGNNYLKNRATFDFSDELVLSDGLIYDVRSGKMLHKLDKFNSNMNGVFHPNGREIISNSEIWDIRTFKLLRTVAGLDQCRVTFNQPRSVIYAVSFSKDLKSSLGKNNCFYTFDAFDYSTISTVDVKRPVYHLACDRDDRFIATIESMNGLECVCRLYEVGRTKQLGDENGDESEESEESDEENDDDDDDDEDNEGQSNDAPYEADEDIDEINWSLTSDSSDDDETLFSLSTSMED